MCNESVRFEIQTIKRTESKSCRQTRFALSLVCLVDWSVDWLVVLYLKLYHIHKEIFNSISFILISVAFYYNYSDRHSMGVSKLRYSKIKNMLSRRLKLAFLFLSNFFFFGKQVLARQLFYQLNYKIQYLKKINRSYIVLFCIFYERCHLW